MLRRKDFTSLLRNMEKPLDRKSTIGVISSISKDGQIINGQDTADGEVRDMHIALPYGISSSGTDGIRVQIMVNDNKNNTVIGVIDHNRPKVRSGCMVLYDKSGQRIILNGDGTIDIYGDVRINGVSFNNILNRIKALEDKIG